MGLVLVLFSFAMILSSCSRNKEDTLRDIAPGLSEYVAERLAQDDADFSAFANDVGIEVLRDSYILLKNAIPLDSHDNYRATATMVLPAMGKIAQALDTEYDVPTVLVEYEILSTPERGVPYRTLHIAQQEIFHNPELATAAKLDSLLRLLPQTERLDMLLLRPSFKYPISNLYANLGDPENELRYLREALSDARETRSYGWECQLLGVLGSLYIRNEDVDPGTILWDEALDIATSHRMAQHSARIASFYAWHYAGEGRLSLAHELFNESQELCRKYKGGYYEIRYVLDAMKFQAELGCWEIVDRLYQRVRGLERQYIEPLSNLPNQDLKHITRVFKSGADIFEARLLMERGEAERANRRFQELQEPVRQIRGHLGYPQFLYHWAAGLTANGRSSDAMPLILEGVRNARASHLNWLAAEFSLLGARVMLSQSHFDAALKLLDEFEDLYEASSDNRKKRLRREWALKEVVRARVYLNRGDRHAADMALESGLTRLETFLATLDKGAQGYVWLSSCGEIRQLLRDLTAHDAVLSYGADLYWRSLYRHLGGYDQRALSHLWTISGTNDRGSSSIYDHVRSLALEASMRIAKTGATHVAYSVGGGAVHRWTVDQNGIRADTLDADAQLVRERVARVWPQLSTDPGDRDASPPAALIADLHSLAKDLLPGAFFATRAADAANHATQLLFVSGDGYLEKIPFEALNVGSRDRYEPLLERYDVAYLRHIGTPVHGAKGGPGVILAATDIAPRLRDRYPLAGELTHALQEGETVARLNPNARFLHGASANKPAVMSAWKDARFIYLAAHVLRDPEVPYLALIPVSAPAERSGPDAAYVDISDIRSQSLNACQIVVLSGCSSGAPYLTSHVTAPGLGDVFLDAGAGAVVQTFWAVADDNARDLMTAYVKTWKVEGMPAMRELNEVRRAALRGPNGVRHPFGWASYSIKLERF